MKDDFDPTPRILETAKTNAVSSSNEPASGVLQDGLEKIERPVKVVFVNDNVGNLTLMEEWILGCFKNVTLYSFASGDLAWELLQREEPDLLITDMCRPNDVLDGWKMIPLLMEKKVKYPVLVLSGCMLFNPDTDHPSLKAVSAHYCNFLEWAQQCIQIKALCLPIEFERLGGEIISLLKEDKTGTA